MMVSEKIFFIILIEIYICIFKILWIICWHFELLETVLICAQYVFGCNTVIYVGNFQNTDRINFWRYILQHVSQKYLQAIFIIGRKFFSNMQYMIEIFQFIHRSIWEGYYCHKRNWQFCCFKKLCVLWNLTCTPFTKFKNEFYLQI